MNLLDENFPADQAPLLRAWRIPFRQIGREMARLGTKDPDILPLLHRHRCVTFFTQDGGFFESTLCHPAYCLVWLDVRTMPRFMCDAFSNTRALTARRSGWASRPARITMASNSGSAIAQRSKSWDGLTNGEIGAPGNRSGKIGMEGGERTAMVFNAGIAVGQSGGAQDRIDRSIFGTNIHGAIGSDRGGG